MKMEKESSDTAVKSIRASNLYRKYSTLQTDCSRLEAVAKEVEDLRGKNRELRTEKANLRNYLSQARKARDHHKANPARTDQEAVNSFLSDAVPVVTLRKGNPQQVKQFEQSNSHCFIEKMQRELSMLKMYPNRRR